MAESPVWIPALLGAGPGFVVAFLGWRAARRKDKGEQTAAEFAAQEKMRASVDAQALAVNDRLIAENLRQGTRIKELGHDRDRGWDLARWWFNFAHSVKHRKALVIELANSRLVAAQLSPVPVPDIAFPGFEEPDGPLVHKS